LNLEKKVLAGSHLIDREYDQESPRDMSVSKVTISIDQSLLKRVDRLVRSGVFSNRSHVIQQAIEEKIAPIDSTRLARECAKLHPPEEQALADERLAGEAAGYEEGAYREQIRLQRGG